MKKFVLFGIAGLSAVFAAAPESSANGRYCLHYPGNPNCVAVFYDQNYSYAPAPVMVYQRPQIIYYAPRRIRYAQPYIFYGRRNVGNFQYGGSNSGGGGMNGGGGSYGGGGHHHGGGMGGGKNGGGKNGG